MINANDQTINKEFYITLKIEFNNVVNNKIKNELKL